MILLWHDDRRLAGPTALPLTGAALCLRTLTLGILPLQVLDFFIDKSYMSHSSRAISALKTIARQTLPVRSSRLFVKHTAPARRAFTTTMAPWKPNSDIPKHEMVYFPQMTTSLPSESTEFRRVLWTGLYSQLVLMTVPVGGDIGDEVSLSCSSSSLMFR